MNPRELYSSCFQGMCLQPDSTNLPYYTTKRLNHPYDELRNLSRGALDTGDKLKEPALAKTQRNCAKATTSSPGCR